MKLKNFSFKMLSLIMTIAMLFSVCSTTVLAAEDHDHSDDELEDILKELLDRYKDDTYKYVSFGASNTNGYGHLGYLPGDVSEDPLAASKAEMNVYGYHRLPENSYPYLIAKALDKALGGEEGKKFAHGYENSTVGDNDPFDKVDIDQLAISSMRMEEMRVLLDNDYYGDAYTAWRFTGGENWFGIAEKEGGLEALREAYQKFVEEADLITIDMGWNNFGVYAFNNIKTIMADGKYWKEPEEDQFYEMADELGIQYDELKSIAFNYLKDNLGEMSDMAAEDGKLDLMADTLAYAAMGACYHFDKTLEKIYEINPDVDVVVINIQNLADDLVVDFMGSELALGDIYGKMISLVDHYRRTLSPYADRFMFATAGEKGIAETDLEFLVEAVVGDVDTFLDEIVEWDGDPTSLSRDMKDCFDMYDDNLYVRSIVEYLLVGQALSKLFDEVRTMGAGYGLEVFKNDAKYTYEFGLTRTPEQLLSLNLGALDLNNPSGPDADVEAYGQALSKHLKNLRGEAPNVAAYDYIFEELLASLKDQRAALLASVEGVPEEYWPAELKAGVAQFDDAINNIVPTAKAAFATNFEGVYKTYHNTLNYAYDVVATVVQYAASINKITINADSLAGFNGAADGMMNIVFNDFVNGAMAKFNYELYANGLSTTPVAPVEEYELDESKFDPALTAILVLAVRYELGNSFFAHPNVEGNKQIATAVLETLTKGTTAKDDADKDIDAAWNWLMWYAQENYPELYGALVQIADYIDSPEFKTLCEYVNVLYKEYCAAATPEEREKLASATYELILTLQDVAAKYTYKDLGKIDNYVSLGDSTITGYGLNEYEDNMQNGKGQYISVSAHVLLAKKLFGKDWEDHFENLCQGSLRADDLLILLGGNVEADLDDYYYRDIATNLIDTEFLIAEGVLAPGSATLNSEQIKEKLNALDDATRKDLFNKALAKAQAEYINSVEDADLVSVAIGGGNFLTFAGKYINAKIADNPYELDWARIGIDMPEEVEEYKNIIETLVSLLGNEALASYVPEGVEIANPGDYLYALAEGMVYGYASYHYYYTKVLERIHEINPDAHIVVLDIFNPVDDWSMSIEVDGKDVTVNIGAIMGTVLQVANIEPLVYAVQNENATFVTTMDAETILEAENPGEKLGFADYFNAGFQSNGKAVHASVAGHAYIADQMYAGITTEYTDEELATIALNEFEAYLQLLVEIFGDDVAAQFELLVALVVEYYDDAYAYAYDEAKKAGVIDEINAYLDEADAAIKNAEATLNNYRDFASEEFIAEVDETFAQARKTITTLRALINNADELDAETYGYVLDLLDDLAADLDNISDLLEIAVVDFGHYVDPKIVELNEQAKAQIEALRAAVEAEIAELRAAVEAEIAALRAAAETKIAELRAEAEAKIAALRAEAEAKLAALKAELETAVGEAKAAIEAEIARIEAELAAAIAKVEAELAAAIAKVEAELEAAIAALEAEIAAQIAKLEADLEAAIEAVKARTEEEIIKLQAAVEALIADIDALNRAVKAAIEGTTNAVNGIIADANKYLKENLPEAYDKLVALVLAQIPEVDKYLYDWFYNNPEVVIGFFAEHGDDMAAFLVDNADVIGAILGFIAYNYGEDVLNYVVENGDVLLRDFVAWYKIYGDRVWDILGVYLNALGANTNIFDLDSIYAALNDLAALVAQLGSDFADDAWNKLVESGILEDILSSVESIKAEAYAKLAYLENELRAQLQLQLDALNAELAALNAKLEAAIAAGNAALAAQLKAAIAELEAAIAQVKAELAKIDAMINEVKAVVEKLIADVERIEAIVNKIIDLVESNVDLDAVLPVIKEALKDLNEALRDAIDTAALVDQLEAALKVLLAEGVDALVDYLKAIGTDAANEAAAALEAIAKAALKQLANVIETELVALGAKINEALNTFVKEALTNGYLYLEEYLKENLPEAYDKFVEFILAQIPGASKYVYNWICNNPDVVIGFFAEYGDDMIDFLKDNADTILAVVAYIAEKYGDDVLDYVLDNADVLLPAFVSWYEAYGDKVWTVLDTYLNALGVNTDIFDLDSIYAALNNLAALIAQLGDDFADDAWNKLIESGILEDILESIENVKAEAYGKIAYLENELRAQLQLQLNTLEAELAALNAKLEAAIAAGNAALAAQLKAAIAELEAAIAQVKAELAKIDAMINEVKAAVEELIAAVERIEAIVNKIVDVIESNANLDVILPVIKEALKDLNSALIDAINAAALVEKLETALKILVAEGVDACVNYLKAVGTEVANEVAAALEAIAKAALKQLADAIEAELAVLGAKLNAALKIFIEGALTSDYIRTEDSYYLAIGSDPDYFAQLLAEKLNLKDSFGVVNWNNITPESIAMADLITLSYNESQLSAFAISQAFGYAADYVNYDLKNDVLAYIDAAFDEFAKNSSASSAIKPEVIAAMKAAVIATVTGAIDQTSADLFGDATKAEMDWAGVVGAENLQYVDKAREEMKNAIADANVPEFYTHNINVIDILYDNLDVLGEYKAVIDMFQPEYIRGCFGEYEEYTVKVPVADALAFAGESYAFSVAQFSKSYAETIIMINKVNPDATVVLLGHYNAFNGVTFGDVDLGEIYGEFAKAQGVLPFGYALLADNVVFVDISEAETVYGEYAEGAELTILDFLMFYALDPTITSVSEAGHAYIAEKIFAALNITCEHVDNDNDHNCDLCDIVLSECADEDKDHKCDVCDAVLSECADADKDHNCDYCGAELGECADTDKDHKCDYCGETLSDCADADNDHNCDYCGAELSECADNNNDHKCDVCGETLSECADNNDDHKCDVCGATLSECADKDNDHKCDVCGATLSECADNNNDHKCDYCGETVSDCADDDKDHKCDVCGEILSECVDTDNDNKCDYCGEAFGECEDKDNDHYCDYCGEKISECLDLDIDHYCDICGAEISKCEDKNTDHNCDYCGAVLGDCADDDKDHNCDYCGAELSKCDDADDDHKCDYCGETLSECVDADKDHNCDICGANLGDCADDDKDHNCDYCGATLSDCADDDKDHKCDYCGATMSDCADADKDHNCDYCGAEISKCADANKDHKCDVCGEELSKCVDNDHNHKCDLCGATLSKCDDADKDHKCDYCGETLSECADADKNHKCDLCGATLSECADANKDHKCDLCGAVLSECADANKDHKCDYCGVELSKCDDANKDHKCDYCGAELSKCDDANKDHKCDLCGAVLSECADADKDHKCDYCGATLSECADANKDHKCDYCGATLSECADADKDHKCDYCGAVLSKCDDADKNHKCDYCDAVLSKCDDADKDHKCDYCGAVLSECADVVKNHKCDYCGATLSECADENNDHKCEYCGNAVSEHKWADATCKAPKTCEICGKTEGKVADHQYGDWETVKEATKKEEGEQKKTCKVCGDAVTEAIPMLEKSSPAAPIITAVVIVVVAGLGTAFVVLKKKKIF